jgi:hypothetical protein
VAFFFALRLQNFEDEVLFAESACTGQLQRSGDLGQLGYVFFFYFTYVDFLREGLSFSLAGDGLLCRRAGTRRSRLSSSPLCFGKVLGFAQDVMTFRYSDLVKHLIHGFLNASVRLMKFAGCF